MLQTVAEILPLALAIVASAAPIIAIVILLIFGVKLFADGAAGLLA